MKINISGLPKEKVLMELYNNAHTIMGFEITPDGMKLDHAKRLADESLYYEWINGRELKVDLRGDIVNFKKYNRARKYENKILGFEKGKTAKQIIKLLIDSCGGV
jgi:hypothetical protein